MQRAHRGDGGRRLSQRRSRVSSRRSHARARGRREAARRVSPDGDRRFGLGSRVLRERLGVAAVHDGRRLHVRRSRAAGGAGCSGRRDRRRGREHREHARDLEAARGRQGPARPLGERSGARRCLRRRELLVRGLRDRLVLDRARRPRRRARDPRRQLLPPLRRRGAPPPGLRAPARGGVPPRDRM